MSILLISFSFNQVFSPLPMIILAQGQLQCQVQSQVEIVLNLEFFAIQAQLSNSTDKSIISGHSNLYGLEFLTLSHIGILMKNYSINF